MNLSDNALTNEDQKNQTTKSSRDNTSETGNITAWNLNERLAARGSKLAAFGNYKILPNIALRYTVLLPKTFIRRLKGNTGAYVKYNSGAVPATVYHILIADILKATAPTCRGGKASASGSQETCHASAKSSELSGERQ